MTERITWDTCPQCGRYAAVGWLDGIPVAFDCPRGCQLTADEFARGEPMVGGLPVCFRLLGDRRQETDMKRNTAARARR